MRKSVKKVKPRYTKKQRKQLKAAIQALAYELRRIPIEDPALARKIAFDLRIPARDPRVSLVSSSTVYRIARDVRGTPVPR